MVTNSVLLHKTRLNSVSEKHEIMYDTYNKKVKRFFKNKNITIDKVFDNIFHMDFINIYKAYKPNEIYTIDARSIDFVDKNLSDEDIIIDINVLLNKYNHYVYAKNVDMDNNVEFVKYTDKVVSTIGMSYSSIGEHILNKPNLLGVGNTDYMIIYDGCDGSCMACPLHNTSRKTLNDIDLWEYASGKKRNRDIAKLKTDYIFISLSPNSNVFNHVNELINIAQTFEVKFIFHISPRVVHMKATEIISLLPYTKVIFYEFLPTIGALSFDVTDSQITTMFNFMEDYIKPKDIILVGQCLLTTRIKKWYGNLMRTTDYIYPVVSPVELDDTTLSVFDDINNYLTTKL